MEGQFSGKVSTVDIDTPVKLKRRTIVDDIADPRISVIKEYLSKAPNASLKDIKKALTGFSKASDSELKDLIKSASEQKFNEIFSSSNTSVSHPIKNTDDVIIDKNGDIVDTTNLSPRTIAAYKANMTMRKKKLSANIPSHNVNIHSHTSDINIREKIINLLYESGYNAQNVNDVKPILYNLIKENSDYRKIELAIEFLKS